MKTLKHASTQHSFEIQIESPSNKTKALNKFFPKHLQIEVVAGYCPSRCIMCTIEKSPRKEIITNEKFQIILDKFKPYLEHIEYTTLHGLGEPLLDKKIANKINLAKKTGFPNVGFATVAGNLSRENSKDLIQSGLDTIIFSVDGIKKETHEAIRVGIDFKKTISSIEEFICIRNKYGKTKIIIRMIRQKLNRNEWNDYKEFWTERLNAEFGDQVSVFDVHNWGGDYGIEVTGKIKNLSKHSSMICSDLYERFFVYANGEVGLCCGDEMGWFHLGNVLHEDPINIYNRGKFLEYRQRMQSGDIANLPHCQNCSIILSRLEKKYLDVA